MIFKSNLSLRILWHDSRTAMAQLILESAPDHQEVRVYEALEKDSLAD